MSSTRASLANRDLLQETADLIAIPSESFNESELVDHLEQRLRAVSWLHVDRVGDNLVARTDLGHDYRLLIGGHSDTVPANGNETPTFDGDVLYGLGATDMKGGLAVMMALAESVERPAVDLTWLFYAREEVSIIHNGLRELFAERPDLCEADTAILCEPTSAQLEAGCQGTVRFELTLCGERAHTARAWMGKNAIHRLGEVLGAINGYVPRQPVIDGCHFHEALQCVFVSGGVAGNVVPDSVKLTIGHRFAPDRTAEEAIAHVQELLAPYLDGEDVLEVVDSAIAAAPSLTHPILAGLINRNDVEVNSKLGWTDVAFFAERGIPAANFGPGDAPLAHTAGEWVSRESLETAYRVLNDVITTPPNAQ